MAPLRIERLQAPPPPKGASSVLPGTLRSSAAAHASFLTRHLSQLELKGDNRPVVNLLLPYRAPVATCRRHHHHHLTGLYDQPPLFPTKAASRRYGHLTSVSVRGQRRSVLVFWPTTTTTNFQSFYFSCVSEKKKKSTRSGRKYEGRLDTNRKINRSLYSRSKWCTAKGVCLGTIATATTTTPTRRHMRPDGNFANRFPPRKMSSLSGFWPEA